MLRRGPCPPGSRSMCGRIREQRKRWIGHSCWLSTFQNREYVPLRWGAFGIRRTWCNSAARRGGRPHSRRLADLHRPRRVVAHRCSAKPTPTRRGGRLRLLAFIQPRNINPGLQGNPPDPPRHGGRQRNPPACKTDGSRLPQLSLLPDRCLPQSRWSSTQRRPCSTPFKTSKRQYRA